MGKTQNMGWLVQICDGGDDPYITRDHVVPHKWASIEPPCSGGFEDIQFWKNCIYVVDKENGYYWRARIEWNGGDRIFPEWENLGGDGGSRICVGNGYLFGYCYSGPGVLFRSDSPGTGGTNDHWETMQLPEEGLRGWGIYDGELYFTCGDNGNYYKVNCNRFSDPIQMYGDGGWELACGNGYMIVSAVDPRKDANEAFGLCIGKIGRKVAPDHDGLQWEGFALVPGGVNSITIYNGTCHVIAKTHMGDRLNLAMDISGFRDTKDDPGAWEQMGGDGGWKHHCGGSKKCGGYKGNGHHGFKRRAYVEEWDDDWMSSDDSSDSYDEW